MDRLKQDPNAAAKPLVLALMAGAVGVYLVRCVQLLVANERPLNIRHGMFDKKGDEKDATPALCMSSEAPALYLVNTDPAESAAILSVLGSWASSLELKAINAVDYGTSGTNAPAAQARVDALSGLREIDARGFCVAQTVGLRIAPPGMKTARGNHELLCSRVPREKLLKYAAQLSGCVAELTCYVALAVSKNETRLYQHTSHGRICVPAKVPSKAASMEDIFVLDASDLQALCPLVSALHPVGQLGASGFDPVAGGAHLAECTTAADIVDGMSSALLVRPYRWRAYLDLAYDIQYADMEKRWKGAQRADESRVRRACTDVLERLSTDAAGIRYSVSRSLAALGLHGKAAAEQATAQHKRELMGQDPQNPLCGRFENHITVNFADGAKSPAGDKAQTCDSFMRLAAALDIKVVSIALPKGAQYPAQVMTSYYTTGHVRNCTEALIEQGLLLTLCGFRCVRVKMELQLTEDKRARFFQRVLELAPDAEPSMLHLMPWTQLPVTGLCPYEDSVATDRRAMTALQYFEFHVKVAIPEARLAEITPVLRDVAQRHGAHLSKNAFKVYVSGVGVTTAVPDDVGPSATADESDERMLLFFLTLRKYSMGFTACIAKLKALQAETDEALRPLGGRLTTVQREYSVFDSNTGLDAGWFERSQATPSFMAAE